MFSINTSSPSAEKCQYCSNSFIEYIGTQPWCIQCKKTINIIQQQTKVVPKMYQSNSKLTHNSTQLKIIKYLDEFGNKYGGILDLEQLNFLTLQVIQIRNKKGCTTKSYRQNSAVIIYNHLKDVHRLTIKEFCKNNQIELKGFNKSYFAYQKIIKENQSKLTQNRFKQFKNQCKYEEDLKMQEFRKDQYKNFDGFCQESSSQIQHFHLINEQNRELKHENQYTSSKQYFDKDSKATLSIKMLNQKKKQNEIQNFLELVFDDFFDSILYQGKKILLKKQLCERIFQQYNNLKLILNGPAFNTEYLITNTINQQSFYHYLLFIVLKKLSHKISQIKYQKIIQTKTGQSIKSNILKQITKILEGTEQTTSISGDSIYSIQHSGTTGSDFVKIQQKE